MYIYIYIYICVCFICSMQMTVIQINVLTVDSVLISSILLVVSAEWVSKAPCARPISVNILLYSRKYYYLLCNVPDI